MTDAVAKTTETNPERAALKQIWEWMREPDWAENFSMADIARWINTRPIPQLLRLMKEKQVEP